MKETNNEILFKEYQEKYPNLATVRYENNKLIFGTLSIDLSKISLKNIPENVFNFSPLNLYTYLNNEFYKNDPQHYQERIDIIFNLFLKLSLTPKEVIILKQFAYDFWLRLKLFYEEPSISKDEFFMNELKARQKVITESFKSSSLAGNQIKDIYNTLVSKETTINSNNDPTEQNHTENKGLSLVRTKPGLPTTLDEEEKLGIAGFSSALLILITTLVVGLYLASKFLP